MGITRESMNCYNCKQKIQNKKVHFFSHKYSYKKSIYSKNKIYLDLTSTIEDNVYNLNTSAMHLQLYIKQIMNECINNTRNEITTFYAMAKNLYKETSKAYYDLMNYKISILDVDIKKLQDTYNKILNLCEISSNEIHDALFDENDDGYETTPREGEYEEAIETPDNLCQEMEEDDETTSDDELYTSTIKNMHKYLSIK
jgi:hypothetical protein